MDEGANKADGGAEAREAAESLPEARKETSPQQGAITGSGAAGLS